MEKWMMDTMKKVSYTHGGDCTENGIRSRIRIQSEVLYLRAELVDSNTITVTVWEGKHNLPTEYKVTSAVVYHLLSLDYGLKTKKIGFRMKEVLAVHLVFKEWLKSHGIE